MNSPETTRIWAYGIEIRCAVSFAVQAVGPRGSFEARLTVRGAFEFHIQLADVIIYKLDFPIAHHPAVQRWESAGDTKKYLS